MQVELPQLFGRLFVVTLVVAAMVVNAKPPHFAADTLPAFNNEQDNALMANTLDSGLRPWQLELLAQRMSELNQISQMNNLNGQDYNRFDRELRSGNEIKRQSRYRLCYFNPVSCFRR